jgi:hypothetical protein
METPVDPVLTSALKHYEAMRRAQKKYYEKKMDAKGPRRGPGRPKKVAAGEGGASKEV